MAHFGLYAPFGLLTCGTQETDVGPIYNTMIDAQKGAFAMTGSSHVEASALARAFAIASCRALLRNANAQRHPSKAAELLPVHERRYGVIPTPSQSDEDRRAVVTARKIISGGPKRSSLQAALRALLGTDFIALRTVKQSEATTLPASPGLEGAFGDPHLQVSVFDGLF